MSKTSNKNNYETSSVDQSETGVDVDHHLKEQQHDSADELLWSDCTEELYLRRILAERHQQGDDFTLVDSIMGRSTVAEIFYNNRNSKDSDQDYPRDDPSWTNFNPIAGSVATEVTDPVDSSFSAEGNSTPSSTPEKKSPPPSNQPFLSYDRSAERENGVSTLEQDQDPLKSMFDPSILKYVDMDEESTGSIPRNRMPEEVDTFEYQDDEEEATLTDGQATRSGLSTLTGDTTIRYLPPPGTPVHYDNPKWYSDVGQQYQYGSSSLYLDPNQTPVAKGSGQNQPKNGRKVSKPKGKSTKKDQAQRRNNSGNSNSASNRSARSSNKRNCCCSSLIHRLTEDDKLFRRTVIIAVVFILIFLGLAVVALMHSGNLVFSRSNEGTSPGMQQPTPPPSDSLRLSTDPPAPAPAPDNGSPPKPAQNLVNSVPAPEQTATIVQPDPESSDFQASDLITDPFRYVSNLIFHRSRRSMQALADQLSPQFQALLWVSDEMTEEGRTIPSDDKIFQRWTLAVLYHSLNGPGWGHKDGWMTTTDECNWFSTATEPVCNNDGLLVRLELHNNGLLGTLPVEISVLPNTLAEINLEGNILSGPIPTEMGRLSSLLALTLANNRLAGSIPSQLGNLADLEILDLSTNFLTGELHIDLFDLENIESLLLEGNRLSGRLSERIERLSNLRFLELEGNDLTGMIPEAMCARRTETGLLQIMTLDCDKIDCSCCDDTC